MKVSIITPVFNGQGTIGETIENVLNQEYKNIEHIIIDGNSTDGTLEMITDYTHQIAKVVSELDQGIYDALNKGIRLSTGDIIGILHAGDLYAHDRVLKRVVDGFEKQNKDGCYGDLQYVDQNDPNKVIRYWKSSSYRNGKFKLGWMPPHPTFFVKREVYEKYGVFNREFRIAGDYELMLRFLAKEKISVFYIPEVLVKMRMGGISNRSVKDLWIKSREDYKAWKINHLTGSILTILLKNLFKLPQFLRRR
jgi:glycosyltransferase